MLQREGKSFSLVGINYLLDGTKILSETHTYSDNANESYTLNFLYDESGSVIGFKKDGATYFYQKNLQGDIIRIVSVIGVTFVEYTYDAWGNILSVTGDQADTLGQLNPFRYRSYYYDTETGFYYLNSRYYDPEVGRFLNADKYVSTGQGILGYNMYIYCNNNPVMYVDPLGTWTISLSSSVSIALGFGGSYSSGIVIDDDWNIEWQYSYAVPWDDNTAMVGGVGGGAGLSLQFTGADTVYDLYGSSTYIGASGGPLWYVGADIISFSDASDSDMTLDGIQLTGGVGIGVDIHVIESYTSSKANDLQKTVSNMAEGSLKGLADDASTNTSNSTTTQTENSKSGGFRTYVFQTVQYR